MSRRDLSRTPTTAGRTRPPAQAPGRPAGIPVAALQHAVGNRGMGQVLARRDAGKNAGTFENSVIIGKSGPIEVTESNIADWVSKKGGADDLVLTTKSGKHSAELKGKSDTRTRVDKIEVSTVTGQNSFVVITFKNARIRGYVEDASAGTESWKAVDFDAVDIKRTSIGKPRP
jgi:hypothetical protein